MAKNRDKLNRMKKHPGGRPPLRYDPELHPVIVRLYMAAGGTVEGLAEELGISRDTLYRWRKRHPEFRDAWMRGYQDPVAKIEGAMYKLATGYEEDDVRIFQFQGRPVVIPYRRKHPPDAHAGQFLLKNYDPERFKDKHEVHQTSDTLDIGLPPEKFPDD